MIDIEAYHLETESSFYSFEFVSEGKRKINKVIKFTPIDVPNVCNLGFGDTDSETGLIDDQITSNNGDTQRVLATVARAVWIFTEKHPDWLVFATGVTPARTRLYRMGITQYWAEISANFTVWGFFDEDWEDFIPNRAYSAFLVKRKTNDI